MNLNKLYLTNNKCYIDGKKINVKGIMVHSTGANNPWLKRYLPDDGKIGVNTSGNHWDKYKPDGRSVCVHGFIGKLADGTIATYQTLPWNYRSYHAGGSANNSYIGFEICEDGLNDVNYFNAVYKEAVELCVYLCREFDLTEKDIICHCEGYKKGIASNHGDVMHWFPRHGKSMDTFRADVKRLLEEEEIDMEELREIQEALEFLTVAVNALGDRITKLENPMVYNYIDQNMPEWARPTVQKLVDEGKLVGNEKGELGISEDLLRTLVIINR